MTRRPVSDGAALVDRGAGTPIILLHGTLMDHRMFEPQYHGLSDSMRVIAYDLRARGKSATVPYSLDDLADDCWRVLDDLGIRRCVIGGMSMGAFTALRVALRHPARVSGMVLIGGQADGFSPSDRDHWAARYASRRGSAVGAQFASEELEFNFYTAAKDRDPELLTRWHTRFAGSSGDALHYEVQSWLGMEDVRERLPALPMPTLVVHGDRDASIPVEAAVDMYRLLPDSELLVLPQTGHAANLERPDQVNSAIRSFMKRIDTP